MYHLSLKKLPKSYRQKQILSFSIEQVNNKVYFYTKIRILFLLLEEGILVSTDLTNVKKSWIPQNALIWIVFNEMNTSVILIIVINLITLVVYSRYFRRNNTIQNANNNVIRRNQEINQVLRDVMRANNQAAEPEILNQVENNNNNINNNIIQNGNEPQNDNPNNPVDNQIVMDNNQIARDPMPLINNENNLIQSNNPDENSSFSDTNHISDFSIKRENPQQIEEEKSSNDPSIQRIIENNKFLREIQLMRVDNSFDKDSTLSQPQPKEQTSKENNETRIKDDDS